MSLYDSLVWIGFAIALCGWWISQAIRDINITVHHAKDEEEE
jgi:hypothetical protein